MLSVMYLMTITMTMAAAYSTTTCVDRSYTIPASDMVKLHRSSHHEKNAKMHLPNSGVNNEWISSVVVVPTDAVLAPAVVSIDVTSECSVELDMASIGMTVDVMYSLRMLQIPVCNTHTHTHKSYLFVCCCCCPI
jgi:hypothetical protein